MTTIAFHRPVRTYSDHLPDGEIVVAAPPALPQDQAGGGSWIPILIPLVSSIGLVAFVAVSRNVLMMFASGVMVVALVGSSFLLRYQQSNATKGQAKANRAKYARYLEQVRMRLDDLARRQQRLSDQVFPPPDQLLSYIERREHLWERREGDDDFLQVRLASGVAPLCCPVLLETGTNVMVEYDQESLTRARLLVTKYSEIEQAAITLPLRGAGTIAISGDMERARALVRAMICHTTTFHAPDDVRLVAYFPTAAAAAWSWLKWLPHARLLRPIKQRAKGRAESLCMLADTVEDLQELFATQIEPELERRRKLGAEAALDPVAPAKSAAKPHFILVLDGFTLDSALARTPALAALFSDAGALGVTILCLTPDPADEPPVVQGRLQVAETGWFAFEETALNGRQFAGLAADRANLTVCEQVARALAPITLGDKGRQYDLSQDVRLLDLLGIPAADLLDTAETWRPRGKHDLLRAPIGVTASGEPLILDVKESAAGGMGPHGLIIGATGSGKSELLRTIVTSLAIEHDPQTLNFVLADFKGGASFADLAALPHSAGMITNLQSDLTQVDRMRASLSGEQERRQRMLREAGNLDNIQQYQTKRQLNPDMEPMPYLMIIVDEFAELLANRPEFLDLFVAIGRVGRSLGMHLLLATQRLGEGRISGLEGHLRYRICLRTFSASESMDVIKTHDAFYLPSFPGIGYFKVDTTIYEQFKTALVSNPYVPPADDSRARVETQVFTSLGRLLTYTGPGSDTATTQSLPRLAAVAGEEDAQQTDMDVIISRLVRQQTPQPQTPAQAPVHQVWLPPLSAAITLGDVFDRLPGPSLPQLLTRASRAPVGRALSIPIGILDRPAEQTQEPLILDFSGAGGHLAIAGGPQTGKSTLLQTIITAFAATHAPREVQFYCLDLGGGLLRALEDVPHVGAVCGKSERDKVRRLIRQMRTIIQEREFLFHEQRIDTVATFRARRQAGEFAETPFGDVFLVIDDVAQLQAEFEGIDADLAEIIAAGLTYGVHVMLAANRWGDIRSKLRDNIAGRLELRLNDPLDSEAGKAAALSIPVGAPGRGLLRSGLQFQIALPRFESSAEDGQEPASLALDAFVRRLRARWPDERAQPIRLLPTRVDARELPGPEGDATPGAPIGLDELELKPVYIDLLTAGPHFMTLGNAESGKTALLRLWMRELERRYTPEQVRFAIADYRRNLLEFATSSHLFAYTCTPPMLKDCVERLKSELEGRVLTGDALTLDQVLHPNTWKGPHYFFFVDDYEQLIGSTGNPLQPLLELIGQGRDIGFHIVMTRQAGGASRAAFEPVYQRIKEMGTPGLILDGDPQEGFLIGSQKASAQPPGRGYLVRRGHRTSLVQVAFAQPATLVR